MRAANASVESTRLCSPAETDAVAGGPPCFGNTGRCLDGYPRSGTTEAGAGGPPDLNEIVVTKNVTKPRETRYQIEFLVDVMWKKSNQWSG